MKDAIKECREAGIKTVMITGDHVDTAKAVAESLDMLPEHGSVMTGSQLDQLNDGELKKSTSQNVRICPCHT